MLKEDVTSIVRHFASVEIDELESLCLGFLSESQQMSAEDRTIAANLLGDAAEISTTEGGRVGLLRITEAAIGGVAMGDFPIVAALLQRHKTEMKRSRQKAATASVAAAEAPAAALEVPVPIAALAAELEAPAAPAPVAELEVPALVTPAPVAELEAPAAPVAELDEVPAAPVAEPAGVRRRKTSERDPGRDTRGRFTKKRNKG